MTSVTEKFIEANKKNWDSRVEIHLRNSTKFYAIDELLNGGDALGPIEGLEIGNVSQQRVIHLQCHFGLDTLSLARRGALVTGVDFSAPAIEAAHALAKEAGLDARFVLSDVTRAAEMIDEQFDIVFTTWGTVGWLPDLQPWAETVAALLAPAGRLYFADGHPFMWQLDEDDQLPPAVRYDRLTPHEQPIHDVVTQTYTGDSEPLDHPSCYGWNHPISEILGALLKAGLKLNFLHEHDEIPWKPFAKMVPSDEHPRMFRLPDGAVRFPLALSLGATKNR